MQSKFLVLGLLGLSVASLGLFELSGVNAAPASEEAATETSAVVAEEDTASAPIVITSKSEDKTIIGSFSKEPVVLDGKLDEPVWQTAQKYQMIWNRKNGLGTQRLMDAGVIRVAWDDQYVYIAAAFDDVDVVDSNDGNDRMLINQADALEVFLKPSTRLWYWEIYGTPKGHTAISMYPSRSRLGLQPWPFVKNSGVKAGAHYEGTLNDWSDKDTGFVVELAIPMEQLNRDGQGPTNPEVTWSILTSRYNYSAYNDAYQAELSSVPGLPWPDFHAYENWAKLKLEK